MEKNEYLEHIQVNNFKEYLVSLSNGTINYEHSYSIIWQPWQNYNQTNGYPIDVFEVNSLEQAARKYYWNINEEYHRLIPENYERTMYGDYFSNSHVLSYFRTRLKSALEARDEDETYQISLAILQWGRVLNGNKAIIDELYHNRGLVNYLLAGIRIMDGNNDIDIHLFSDQYRMTSGMTKLYSLGSRRSIIYDGRVGAALCLLIRTFLHDEPHRERLWSDPYLLKFSWGSEKTTGNDYIPIEKRRRNPNGSGFNFFELNSGQKQRKSYRHALVNIRANWLVQHLADELDNFNGASETYEKLRMIEAALFMIGYEVNNNKKNDNKNVSHLGGNIYSDRIIEHFVIDAKMTRVISECKKFRENKKSKKEVALYAFKQLDSYSRKQVIRVFIDGCGLTKNGASTYYSNCSKEIKENSL